MYKATLGKSGASRTALPSQNGGSGIYNSNITKSQANLNTVHSLEQSQPSNQGGLQTNYSVSTLGKIRSSVQSDLSTKNRQNTNSSNSNAEPSGFQRKTPLDLNMKQQQQAKIEVKQSTSPSSLRHLKLNSSHNIFKASALSPFSKNTPNQQQKQINKTPSGSINAAGTSQIPSANKGQVSTSTANNNNTKIATLDLTNEVKQTSITPFSTNIDHQQENISKHNNNNSHLSNNSNDLDQAKSALLNLKSKMTTQRNHSQTPSDHYQNQNLDSQFDQSSQQQNRRGKPSTYDPFEDNDGSEMTQSSNINKNNTSNNFRDAQRENRQNPNAQNNHQNSRSPFQNRDQGYYDEDRAVKSSKLSKHANNEHNHNNYIDDDRDNNLVSSHQPQRSRKPGSYSDSYNTKQSDDQLFQGQQQQHRPNFDDHYTQQQQFQNQQYHPPPNNYPSYPRQGQQSYQNYPPYDQNRYMQHPSQYYNDPHINYHNDSHQNMYQQDHLSYKNYPVQQGARGYQQSFEWKGRNDLGRVMSYENFKRNSHNSYQQRYPDDYPPQYYHQEQIFHRGAGMDYNPQGPSYNHSTYGGFFDPRGPPPPPPSQNPQYRMNGYYDNKYSNYNDGVGNQHSRLYDEYPRNNGPDRSSTPQDSINYSQAGRNPNGHRQPTEPFPSERYTASSDSNRFQTQENQEGYSQQQNRQLQDDRSQRDFPQEYPRRDKSPMQNIHARGDSNHNGSDATSRATTTRNNINNNNRGNNPSETSTTTPMTASNRDVSRNRYDDQPDYYKYNESRTTRNTQRDSYTPDASSIGPQSRAQKQPYSQTPYDDDSNSNGLINSRASKKSVDLINAGGTKPQPPSRNTGSDIPRDFKMGDPFENSDQYSEPYNIDQNQNPYQKRSLSNNGFNQNQPFANGASKNPRQNYGSNDHSIHDDKPINRANTAIGLNSNNRIPFEEIPIKVAPSTRKPDSFAIEQGKGQDNQRNVEFGKNVRDQPKGNQQSGASFDDIPIKGSKNSRMYAEAIDDNQDEYVNKREPVKSQKSPMMKNKPQQNSRDMGGKRQMTDWEESELEVNDEYHNEERPSIPRDFKTFQGNYDSVDDDRPIKPSAAGNNYDLKSIPKSAISNPVKPAAQQQKGRINGGPMNKNIGNMGSDENGPVNIQLRECSQGCGRKFQLESLPKHEKICKKVFQQQRKVFDSSAMRTNIEELAQFNGGTSNYNKGPPGKKSAKQQQPAREEKQKPKQADAGGKPRWLKQSEAFRAVIKMNKGDSSDGGANIPSSEAFSKEDYVQCNHCGRKFNETAAKRHIPFCAKKAKETSMKGPAPTKVLGSNNNQTIQSNPQPQQRAQQPQKFQQQQPLQQQQSMVSPQLKNSKSIQSKAPASGYTVTPSQIKRHY